MRGDLPTGTVTFLFTDVEGSTKLLEEIGDESYDQALAEHRRIVRAACAAQGGVEVDTQGDAFFFAFRTAPGALAAASELTSALASGPIRVRIGLHTGRPRLSDEGYVGKEVHFAARLAATGHGGQIVLSKATAELVDGSLTELGEHRLKDIAEPVPIYQLGEERFPPLKTISNTNLPRPASSFVGRDRELNEVLSKISQRARLLTLTGPGGSGKTRLALEAAATLIPDYKAGVFWVGLASLRDPALVTETISQTLGAKDGLAEHIGEREMLLLLDNLEQVIEAAPELSALVERCPNLALLATSRERLRVQGEVEYEVPPLASPEAVALFCERARLEPSGEIAELCARLDNLPLAVELAAARTKALSPAQIVERLSQRLDLLKGGRDADARQQTLRATIAWSYDLLSEEEQRLFRSLAIFAGGCALEAAEEVADADLDTLQSLVEKSLLRFSTERYWMLETIRDYARERLDDAGETGALARRHADYHLALLEERQPLVRGSGRRELLAWFGEEEDNLRATLDYLEGAAPQDAARAEDLLMSFWGPRGRFVEGQERLLRLLARTDFAAGTRAMLLEHLSDHELQLGQLDSAESHAQEAVTLARESDERRTLGFALQDLARVASRRGDLDEAIRVLTRVLDEAADDEWLRAIVLGDLASLQAETGRDEEAARHMFQEASRGFHATADEANQAITGTQLATLELFVRDFEAAYNVAASVLEKVRAIGGLYVGIAARNALGFAALGLGRTGEARAAFAESLDLVLAADRPEGALPETLAGIALATDTTDARSAARLQGAVNKLDEPVTRSPRFLQLERYLGQPIIDALGADEYAKEQALGAGMDTDDAIDLARTLANPESQGAVAES